MTRPLQTGLVAEKLGMTRIFDETGQSVAVTVLQMADAVVTANKTTEKDGYNAVQIGMYTQKEQRVSKPMKGHFKKAGTDCKRVLREFRVDEANLLEVGSDVKVDRFAEGTFVDVTGTSKGHGFTGAMKRWNFGGLRASHGVSVSHRSHGSIGQCQDPGRVFKGKKMAGHGGDARVTQQNLKVVKVDVEKGVLMIKGSIPGSRGHVVLIKDAVKKLNAKAGK